MMDRRRMIAMLGLTAASGLASPLALAETTGDSPKRYFSDYISFVGRDAQGYVFLAHDNNRGQTGDRYFADHWIAMYDDVTGWVDVKGSAHYPNPGRLLESIPRSEHFVFSGTPLSGLSFNSTSNDMVLSVEPLPKTLQRESADGIFWVGGAPAKLTWKGRTLVGRVLFEYLQRHNDNRFTSNFEARWNNFNGLYLLTDSGHDFYVHYHERQGGSDLTGKLVGLASWDAPGPVTDLVFKIPSKVSVPHRSYRMPSRWQVDFMHAGRQWRLDADTAHRLLVADWTSGGFNMATVQGTIVSRDGKSEMAVTGWAELLI